MHGETIHKPTVLLVDDDGGAGAEALYQSDLGETFEWLAQQVRSKHGLTVHVEAHDRVDSRSEAMKAFLYRTAQEMLFNVVKHARTKEARLRLQRVRDQVWLTISDQGQGFDPQALGRERQGQVAP